MNPIFEYRKVNSEQRAFLQGPPELLALLPPPDPQGVALEEIEKSIWVVKENDCQQFSTKEKASLFYFDTTLAYPALRALIPVRAADNDTPCHWSKRLNAEQAGSIYDVLVRLLGAPEACRQEFYEAVVENEMMVTWVFDSWGGHHFTFEYNNGVDFRGHPMTASMFSTLLMSHAILKIKALFRKSGVEPVEIPQPKACLRRPRPELRLGPSIQVYQRPPEPVKEPERKPEKPVLEAVNPPVRKPMGKPPKPVYQRPVISMKSPVPERPFTEAVLCTRIEKLEPDPELVSRLMQAPPDEEDEDYPDMASLLGVRGS